ncbi:MAG: hypothetical protein IH988_11920 [Planctomycetes bacterium]|nr:hypothetical protein [Planctomycetota bacterium]
MELTGEIDVDLTAAQSEHTFDGAGEIVGQQSSAKIMTDADTLRCLVSSITIRGALQTGDFNGASAIFQTAGGVIHADTNGTLKISTQGLDDDTASATLYKVASSAEFVAEFRLG